jgi:hypothetical protein
VDSGTAVAKALAARQWLATCGDEAGPYLRMGHILAVRSPWAGSSQKKANPTKSNQIKPLEEERCPEIGDSDGQKGPELLFLY